MTRRAFTAVEVLMTLGIIAVTAGISVPTYRNFQIRNDLDLAVAQTVHGLARAQLLSQTGQSDGAWGFRVPEGTVFLGENYVVRDTDEDEVVALPQGITVYGVEEVVFERVTGKPSVTGDIIFEAANGEQRTITVSPDGVLVPSGILPPSFGDLDGDDGGSGDVSGDTGDSGASTGGSDSGGDSGSTSGDTGDSGGDSGDGGDSGSTSDSGGSGGDDDDEDESDDDDVPVCEDRFTVADDGNIETTGSVNATFKALGSAITYGAGGPEVQVTVSASTDGGATWISLFGGDDIDGGEQQILSDITSGQHISVKVNGRYGWLFNKTYRSNDGSGHVRVLRNGDTPPDYEAFDNQANLTSFMNDIIDADGHISIGAYDAVLLMELGTLNGASSDFQDAVVLISFAQPSGSCAEDTDPKFKIGFERLENTGKGDAEKKVFVGSDAVAYAENQWIPLTTTDGAIVEDVKGMAAQRKSGHVRVLLHGTLNNGKEIVDARVTFSNAKVYWIENDTTGNNTAESPFDGVLNDGAGGDEADVISGSGAVLFQTRVTGADDAILIYWQESEDDDGSDDGSSSDDASSGSSASSSSTSSSSSAPDACAAAYTITNNRITMTEKADISFSVLGSHALYGAGGPSLQMRLQASTDNGQTWTQLFKYRDVRGGERHTLRDVPAGATVLVRVEGRRGWLFKREAVSGEEGGRIRFLKKGDAAPNTTAFANTSGLQSFLKKRISQGKAVVSSKELLMLAEIQNMDGASDFQDAVVLLTLEKPLSSGICGTADEEDDDASSAASSAQTSSAATSSSSDDGEGGSSSSSSVEPDRVICHFPPGNPKQSQTLTVGPSAVSAHLAHGDRYGECEGDEDGDGIQNSSDLCPDTYVPEEVPSEGLLFNRFALTHNEFAFREGPRRRVSEFTLSDTHGCSCEQLIDVAENAKTYRFSQFPSLLRDMRSLFPFYTDGARRYGCGKAVIDMVRKKVK